MNERIKLLVKQAGGIGHNDDSNELTPALVGKSLEKFAELIIQECSSICYKTFDNGDEIAGLLMQTFGVEE